MMCLCLLRMLVACMSWLSVEETHFFNLLHLLFLGHLSWLNWVLDRHEMRRNCVPRLMLWDSILLLLLWKVSLLLLLQLVNLVLELERVLELVVILLNALGSVWLRVVDLGSNVLLQKELLVEQVVLHVLLILQGSLWLHTRVSLQ